MKNINHEIAQVSVGKLKEHPSNPRRGNERAIEASIEANGFYGVIVAQKSTGFVLAGNHRLRAAIKKGAKKVPVAWVDVDDEAAKKILVADNKTSDLGDYDDEALARLLDGIHADTSLDGTGYAVGDLDELISSLDKSVDVSAFSRTTPAKPQPKYTDKIIVPIYEPHGAKPDIKKLADSSWCDDLRREIKEAKGLSDEDRRFLLTAATRLVRFNFKAIANYFAHSDEATQGLMEKLALVIVDYDKAYENGFVRLSKSLLDMEGEDASA